MSLDLDQARLHQGAAAVLPIREAVRLLPGRDAEIRTWLSTHGLVRQLNGADVVIWGDVLEVLRADEEDPKPKPRRTPPPKHLPRRADLS